MKDKDMLFENINGTLVNLSMISEVTKCVKTGKLKVVMQNGNSYETNLTETAEFDMWYNEAMMKLTAEGARLGMEIAKNLFHSEDDLKEDN
jgi:hypothetical protein